MEGGGRGPPAWRDDGTEPTKSRNADRTREWNESGVLEPAPHHGDRGDHGRRRHGAVPFLYRRIRDSRTVAATHGAPDLRPGHCVPDLSAARARLGANQLVGRRVGVRGLHSHGLHLDRLRSDHGSHRICRSDHHSRLRDVGASDHPGLRRHPAGRRHVDGLGRDRGGCLRLSRFLHSRRLRAFGPGLDDLHRPADHDAGRHLFHSDRRVVDLCGDLRAVRRPAGQDRHGRGDDRHGQGDRRTHQGRPGQGRCHFKRPVRVDQRQFGRQRGGDGGRSPSR